MSWITSGAAGGIVDAEDFLVSLTRHWQEGGRQGTD